MSDSQTKIIGAKEHYDTVDECCEILTFIESAEYTSGCSKDYDDYEDFDTGRRRLLRLVRNKLATACDELDAANRQVPIPRTIAAAIANRKKRALA